MFNVDCELKSLLDVGANVGNFSKDFKHLYPNSNVVCIEANPFLMEDLQILSQTHGFEIYNFGASDRPGKSTFNINRRNVKCTGGSFYVERSVHYDDSIQVDVTTERLDDVFSDRSFDFIKIDTQGSDYNTIKGGINLIKRSKFLLVEVSFFPFNDKSVLGDQVITILQQNGFTPFQFVEFHYLEPSYHPKTFNPQFNTRFVSQVDVLWKNKN